MTSDECRMTKGKGFRVASYELLVTGKKGIGYIEEFGNRNAEVGKGKAHGAR